MELALLVVILLVAALFRFYCPDSIPPGPSHDELRMMDLGELIVDGERPIHWTISYSAEPFFMYILALVMPLWGFVPFAARLVTRFAGLLLIPLVHLLARRLFDRRVALVVSGVLALTWWPVFFSRVALRGILLPVAFVAAVYFLWRGLGLDRAPGAARSGKVGWGWLALGGGTMGFTWYVFTAARGLAILMPVFLVYLVLVRLVRFKLIWRVALVVLGLAALVAAPFVYEVQVHPGAPEERIGQLSSVLQELRAGNPLPLAEQVLGTLGVFLFTGDPNWRYNVSGRPFLGPALGLLAVLGVLVSIARWRRPQHFLILVWLLLGLAPSMLTLEAPSFVRAIGALPAVAMFPGIGAVTLWDWLAARAGRRAAWIVPVLLMPLLALNGAFTFHDLFVVWPVQPQAREIYQASLTEAFQALNRSDFEGALWISEPFPDDRNLLLERRLLQREEVKPRWFDMSRALILPPAGGFRHYLLADFAMPDPVLFARWMGRATIVLEGEAPGHAGGPPYRIYRLEGVPQVEGELADIAARSEVFADWELQQPIPLPARFGDTAALVGYELIADHLAPGEEVHLVLYWRARGPVYESLSSFAHLLDQQSQVVGQYDGFDVPPWHWEPGVVVAQVYRFSVGQEAEPGTYRLEVGLYSPQTMERVPAVDDAGVPIADRLFLQKVVVQMR